MPEGVSTDMSAAAATIAPDNEAQSSSAAELRVVYLATAADTSCVSHDDDASQHAVVSVGGVTADMIMDIDDDDDDDSSAETQQGVAGSGTMLQRN